MINRNLLDQKKVFRLCSASCIAMPGPNPADFVRAIARERMKLQIQTTLDAALPSFELRRRRLQLSGLHVPKQRLDGNYTESSSHFSLEISCSTS